MKPWEEINNRLQMIDVVRMYGYEPSRYGSFICCPFHLEKTPSMKIYDKSYYCFGCKEGGQVVNFVMKLYNLSCIDACKKLDEDFRLGIDFGGSKKLSLYELERIRMEEYMRKIEREEQEVKNRQKQGIFEPSEIGKEWDNILYETIVIPEGTNEELKCFVEQMKRFCGDDMVKELDDVSFKTPQKVIKRFRSELVGTPEFDEKLREYNMLVEKRTRELNEEDSYE